MVRGFTGSLLLHGGLLAWAMLGFSMSTPLPQPDEIAVEVAEISTLADVTKQMKGDTTSKNNEAAPAPETPSQVVMQQVAPKPTPTPPPPPPAETAPPPPPPPPPPEPVKAPPEPMKPEPPKAAEVPPAEDKQALEEMLAAEDSKAKAEAAAKAAKEARAKADAEAKAIAAAKAAAAKVAAAAKAAAVAKAAAEAEKKRLAELAKQPPKDFTKSIASAIEGAKAPDLLDKTPKPKGAPPVGAQTASANPNAPRTTNAGSPTGDSNVNQARDQDLLKSQITAALRECWNKPSAGGGVTAPAVTIKWTLANNGTLTGEPKVMQSDRNSPLADQAERAAIRAVQACAPFKLKPELYNIWREITWVFDPNKAL